jgi:hypothetical protein
MQPHGLGQVETSDDVKNTRRNDVRVTAADVEDVERLPMAIDPGADVEEPWRCVIALVYITLAGP